MNTTETSEIDELLEAGLSATHKLSAIDSATLPDICAMAIIHNVFGYNPSVCGHLADAITASKYNDVTLFTGTLEECQAKARQMADAKWPCDLQPL